MTALVWDDSGTHKFETGVDHVVLFPPAAAGASTVYGNGVPWNGITEVNEKPTGGDTTSLYADNMKYLNLVSVEEFAATIGAYTYPDEWEACDGYANIGTGVSIGQQPKKQFCFSYRTKVGNDVDGQDHGYMLHIVYNAFSKPTAKNYATVNDKPDAMKFSWDITTTPVSVPNFKPTACLTIDSTKVLAAKLQAIEAKLYGNDTDPSTILFPSDIITILNAA